MLIFYRIISIFINAVGLMLAISLVFSLPMLLTSPLNLLSAFMIICIVLYTWFSSKFSRNVLQLQKQVNQTLRDWIRVNGIVAIVYSSLVILCVTFLLFNPQLTAELQKNLPENFAVQEGDFKTLFVFMLAYASLLLVHILFTFFYMKKNRQFFVENPAEKS